MKIPKIFKKYFNSTNEKTLMYKNKLQSYFKINNFQISLISIFFGVFIILSVISKYLICPWSNFLQFQIYDFLFLILFNFVNLFYCFISIIIFSFFQILYNYTSGDPIGKISIILLNISILILYFILKNMFTKSKLNHFYKEIIIMIIITISISFWMVILNKLFILDWYNAILHIHIKINAALLFGIIFPFNLLNLIINSSLYITTMLSINAIYSKKYNKNYWNC